MESKDTPQIFKDAVKLVALLQTTLEQMDKVKGTRFYRQRLKQQMKSLETTIENVVLEPLQKLDTTDESLFNRIQENIDTLLDLDLTELSQLRVEIVESRDETS